MAHILFLTKNQKVVVSYVLISIVLINQTKRYLRIKNYSLSKHITKKNFLRINGLVFNFYIFTVLKKGLIRYEQYLIVAYLLKLFNLLEFVLFNFIWYYLKILVLNFGYFFYVVCINPFLQIFWYLFPTFVLKIHNFIVFISNQFGYNLLILKVKYEILIFSFLKQISEIFFILFNYMNLIDTIFYIIKFIILFLEITIILSMALIIPPIREGFFNGFKNWNFQHILLGITNYMHTWINTFSKQKTVWHKILFVLVALLSWSIFSIVVIKHFLYIWVKLKESIGNF